MSELEHLVSQETLEQLLSQDDCCLISVASVKRALKQKSKTGHWITKPNVYGVAYCSECGFELKINDTNYCPNCGAKMSEVEE